MEQLFMGQSLARPVTVDCEQGAAVVYSETAFDKTSGNEDAAGVWSIDPRSTILAVADGMGGGPGGAAAAETAIRAIGRAVTRAAGHGSMRSAIVDGFEGANDRLLTEGVGAGTTLVVAEVLDGTVRVYHAGDSGALVVGQRGRIRLATIPHSPVGYGVAAGMLEPGDVHHHDERHLLSNCVGSKEMRVEIGAPVDLAARDTLLLASDGVLDNVQVKHLVDLIRTGPLPQRLTALRDRVHEAMHGRDPALPAHPDDATALAYRRAIRR